MMYTLKLRSFGRQEGTGLSRSSKDVLIAEVTLENYSKHMNLYKSVLGLLARRRR